MAWKKERNLPSRMPKRRRGRSGGRTGRRRGPKTSTRQRRTVCPPFSAQISCVDPSTDKPAEDPEAIGDPYKTLFVSRLVCNAYTARSSGADILPQHKNATENDLRREFEGFGSIERVRIVRDKNGRSRGYAFIVFERERDMKGTIILLHIEHTHPACIFAPALSHDVVVFSCIQGVGPASHHGQASSR